MSVVLQAVSYVDDAEPDCRSAWNAPAVRDVHWWGMWASWDKMRGASLNRCGFLSAGRALLFLSNEPPTVADARWIPGRTKAAAVGLDSVETHVLNEFMIWYKTRTALQTTQRYA